MEDNNRMEFFIAPDGDIFVFAMAEDGKTRYFRYTEENTRLGNYILEKISVNFPDARIALDKEYEAFRSEPKTYLYKVVSRFIRCNFGQFDMMHFDIEGMAMHIEEVNCPQRCECPLAGKLCKPRPFGLTDREHQIAEMTSKGFTYKEVSSKLGITTSTINNIMTKITAKLKLKSAKDIAKLFASL